MDKNYIIVYKPSLSPKKSSKYYIFESSTDPTIEEMTLIGDVGITAHIVGIANSFNEANRVYKQLMKVGDVSICKMNNG